MEEAIYAHGAIAECAVFGLPDERYGEIVGAVFLSKPGKSVTEAELRDFLATRLAPFKQPVVYWQGHETLPRLGTQKIDKRSLREKYTQDYLAA